MKDKVYEFWIDLICNCARAESEADFNSYLIYHKALITLMRELGVSESVVSRVWDNILIVGNNIFYEEID